MSFIISFLSAVDYFLYPESFLLTILLGRSMTPVDGEMTKDSYLKIANKIESNHYSILFAIPTCQ